MKHVQGWKKVWNWKPQILFAIEKNFLRSGKIVLLSLFIRRAIKLAVVIVEKYDCCVLHTPFYETFLSQG
jgi:hypothetical protein